MPDIFHVINTITLPNVHFNKLIPIMKLVQIIRPSLYAGSLFLNSFKKQKHDKLGFTIIVFFTE